MAGDAVWTRRAERQLTAYLDHLADVRPDLLDEALAELRSAADAVAHRPGIARPARWDGAQEVSVRRWSKLLVLERVGDQLRVLALYDQRQDLSAVDPFSE